MLVVILLSWERDGMNSLCLHWQEHSRFYGCLLSMGSLTALCSRDPWEMLYIHVALQRCALARWQERERQRMSVYESLSQTPACLTPPFPALKSYAFPTDPPNELLRTF